MELNYPIGWSSTLAALKIFAIFYVRTAVPCPVFLTNDTLLPLNRKCQFIIGFYDRLAEYQPSRSSHLDVLKETKLTLTFLIKTKNRNINPLPRWLSLSSFRVSREITEFWAGQGARMSLKLTDNAICKISERYATETVLVTSLCAANLCINIVIDSWRVSRCVIKGTPVAHLFRGAKARSFLVSNSPLCLSFNLYAGWWSCCNGTENDRCFVFSSPFFLSLFLPRTEFDVRIVDGHV